MCVNWYVVLLQVRFGSVCFSQHFETIYTFATSRCMPFVFFFCKNDALFLKMCFWGEKSYICCHPRNSDGHPSMAGKCLPPCLLPTFLPQYRPFTAPVYQRPSLSHCQGWYLCAPLAPRSRRRQLMFADFKMRLIGKHQPWHPKVRNRIHFPKAS